MYSAVEVADFVVDRHLHHGCVVEQCILVKCGQDVVKSRTVVNYHGRDTQFGGLWFLLMTILISFIFLFLFFSLPPGSTFVVSLSVKHVINLVWPNNGLM